MKFLITGLPRSRTAWFASYFTTEDTLCYHEASFHNSDMELDVKNIGNSEAGVELPWVTDFAPDRIIVIHRDIDEVERSLDIIGEPTGAALRERLEELNTRLDHFGGLHVDFYNIDLWQIHDYLGLKYLPHRAELFDTMNIQSKYWR